MWYIAPDGKLTAVPCTYDPKTKLAAFSVTHFSLYMAGTWSSPFSDVSQEDWFYRDTAFVCAGSLMQGVSAGRFDPNGTTTRGMLVTILHRMAGAPEAGGSNPFSDVAEGSYYEKAIIWAAENGLVSDCGNGKFCSDDPITREQLAAILYRYARLGDSEMSAADGMADFEDAFQVSDYAVTAMQWACAEGIINGSDGRLSPNSEALRAQTAAILNRFCGIVR